MQQALAKAVAEATALARQYEKEAGEAAQKQMVEEFGVELYEIDKTPIMERTKPVFEEFGNTSGLNDLIAEIQEVQ